MNIDMGALHTLVAERGISFDDLLEDVKAAVLSAYRHTEGHQPDAHIDIDRKSGSVRVLARELEIMYSRQNGPDPALAERLSSTAAELREIIQSRK